MYSELKVEPSISAYEYLAEDFGPVVKRVKYEIQNLIDNASLKNAEKRQAIKLLMFLELNDLKNDEDDIELLVSMYENSFRKETALKALMSEAGNEHKFIINAISERRIAISKERLAKIQKNSSVDENGQPVFNKKAAATSASSAAFYSHSAFWTNAVKKAGIIMAVAVAVTARGVMSGLASFFCGLKPVVDTDSKIVLDHLPGFKEQKKPVLSASH
jgi:hypothetical protein